MANERVTPVEAARRLGIRPQMVYGFIKHGRVRTFSNPSGKTDLVEFKEVEATAKGVKHHSPKGPDGKPVRRRANVATGALISRHGWSPRLKRGEKHTVEVVTGEHRGDAGEQYVQYAHIREDGTPWEFFWEGDELAQALAKGRCHIETPEGLLAAVMFHWVHNEKPELAAALQMWAEINDLDVPVILEALPGDEPAVAG
jgi:hypothetical protein